MYDFERYHRIRIERIIDGDTMVVSFYLGLGIWLNNQSVRFLGINAPEMKGEEREQGKSVTEFLKKLLSEADDMIVRTDEEKKGKYGRFLVTVFAKHSGKWHNVNELLVERGAAREYMSSGNLRDTPVEEHKEIFDTPAKNIEERVEVDEARTESEVYNVDSDSPTDEEVIQEIVTAAKEVLGVYKGKQEETAEADASS